MDGTGKRKDEEMDVVAIVILTAQIFRGDEDDTPFPLCYPNSSDLRNEAGPKFLRPPTLYHSAISRTSSSSSSSSMMGAIVSPRAAISS